MDDILIKYFNNSATEEEKEHLLHWLEEKEENRNLFRETYDLWLYTEAVLTDERIVEKELARLKSRLVYSPAKKKFPVRSLTFTLTKIAAVILLMFSVGYIGYKLNDTKKEAAIMMNKLFTGENGKSRFTLPDGTIVWLNANSTLTFPETFTEGQRLVHLEGEALFEVTKDIQNPFRVRTEEMDIEVFGTRFLVQNYTNKPAVETVLVEGSVKVSGNHVAEQVLIPGQLIAYNKEDEQTETKTVNTSDYTNWIHSKLVFDNSRLADIVINLEKWYGVEIIVDHGLAEKNRMSFTVRSESLDEVLKYMAATTPLNYRRENNIVYLSSR